MKQAPFAPVPRVWLYTSAVTVVLDSSAYTAPPANRASLFVKFMLVTPSRSTLRDKEETIYSY